MKAEIACVIDRSGSMRGAAMSQAKKALLACLSALSEDDQFSIIAFDDRIDVLNNKLVKGNITQREKATAFIQKITARGGTELLLGIKSAMEILDGQGDRGVVVGRAHDEVDLGQNAVFVCPVVVGQSATWRFHTTHAFIGRFRDWRAHVRIGDLRIGGQL